MSAAAEARVENPIATVLSPRLSGRRVAEFVERLYADAHYTLEERLSLLRGTWSNPYPATFDQINGVRWDGRIYCGHNPMLYARLVDGLRIERTDSGEERAVWTDRPRPTFEWTKPSQDPTPDAGSTS